MIDDTDGVIGVLRSGGVISDENCCEMGDLRSDDIDDKGDDRHSIGVGAVVADVVGVGVDDKITTSSSSLSSSAVRSCFDKIDVWY